jgi:hypothetical protein
MRLEAICTGAFLASLAVVPASAQSGAEMALSVGPLPQGVGPVPNPQLAQSVPVSRRPIPRSSIVPVLSPELSRVSMPPMAVRKFNTNLPVPKAPAK